MDTPEAACQFCGQEFSERTAPDWRLYGVTEPIPYLGWAPTAGENTLTCPAGTVFLFCHLCSMYIDAALETGAEEDLLLLAGRYGFAPDDPERLGRLAALIGDVIAQGTRLSIEQLQDFRATFD